MAYHRFSPHPALGSWVECLWVQESLDFSPVSEPTTVLPTGRPELLVHFHEPFEHLGGAGPRQMPMTFVLGQRTRPIVARASGRTGIVIVGFQPWAAEVLLQGAGARGVDTTIDLEDLDPAADARALGARVDRATSARERAAWVEEFLLRTLIEHEPDRMVVAAVERLNRSWGSLPIGELAADLAVSRRHLQRRFTRTVGLGPKRFARLVRFQKAVGLLRSGYDWHATVAHCGYVDQAHLTRECKAFSGHTPGELRRRPATPLMRYYNPPTLAGVYSTVYC